MLDSMKSHKVTTAYGIYEHLGPADTCEDCLEAVEHRQIIQIEPDRNWLATYIEMGLAFALLAGMIAIMIMK
jgi:hypothetical protein